MRLKGLAAVLVARATTLLVAGAASAQGLLDGEFFAADDKNPRVQSETEVLFPGDDNDVTVAGTCESTRTRRWSTR